MKCRIRGRLPRAIDRATLLTHATTRKATIAPGRRTPRWMEWQCWPHW